MMIRIGLGFQMTSPSRARKPTSHSAGCRAAVTRPPSSGTTGSRLKRLMKKPRNASAARDRELRLAPGVVRHLSKRDQCAHERDEERCRDGESLPFRLEYVSHLVDEQQHDEPDSEPPAADPDVHRGRNEHREEELELEQDDAELGEKRADRGDRRPKPPEEPTPVEALRRPSRSPGRSSARRLRSTPSFGSRVTQGRGLPLLVLRTYDPLEYLGAVLRVLCGPGHDGGLADHGRPVGEREHWELLLSADPLQLGALAGRADCARRHPWPRNDGPPRPTWQV